MMDQHLTIKQTAKLLGFTQETIYRKVNRREIPARKIGRHWRVPVSDLKRAFPVREGWDV